MTDHLGSVAAITDELGTLLDQQRYLPFGAERPNVGSITQTDFGYTGQRDITNTGLMDYKARADDPLLMRFIQPDSIIPNPADPQSWNRYSYVGNRPVMFTDPSGHDVDCAIGQSCEQSIADARSWSFDNVEIENPEDFSIHELDLVYGSLTVAMAAFGGDSSAFERAFGNVTFQMMTDGALGGPPAQAIPSTGFIQLESAGFNPRFGSPIWNVVHEMGHIFDMRWGSQGGSHPNPNLYISNLFVSSLNGGCAHAGAYGCLGVAPSDDYRVWGFFGLDVGNYRPTGATTRYGLDAGSVEDFADSFAGTLLGDPAGVIGPERENIIQIVISLMVTNW